ncbi:uncharacterized protein LOC118743574 [Rhagoletis pomonella]|uniref:uncharacterized protein LOC118743574 n=1 Tax=Rhagoletis pomonella TaxID=28610 RepID=UPI001783A7D4|nr:uncharacterized protein LOC118743574 [Rhagoletis pomonella]
MTVMTFGATCSPSCAQYVKNKNVEEFSSHYPQAAQCIINNHYVDDMFDSVDTDEDAFRLATDVQQIHQKGGFLIRNWVSNSKTVLKQLNAEFAADINLDLENDMSTEKSHVCQNTKCGNLASVCNGLHSKIEEITVSMGRYGILKDAIQETQL